ncbi:hypothetical protein A2Z33_06065 [Candidatus Gottesmanbacteria bacterium RBG_16_52_11]|uniref:Amine oxidase domain-containing protein n=1 Tax=Candidatus Gottesmanbacteria bacterium RBG_16_52_11 TaxID=1798374 RepID=A0A1F5YXM7_9BACT|nr:MAG: hypothetical protein A2Z33_06065 [Candidatus Gottesmanbacteria bacterium RBG_16_52_11]
MVKNVCVHRGIPYPAGLSMAKESLTKGKSVNSKAVIIGGGISGLASAALLAKDGWDTVLLEKNRTVGGRARVLKKNGFTFDMGPSWYLMPEVFERFFSLFGKTPADYYDLVRLDPRYRVFFGNEPGIAITDNPEENAAWFDQVEPGAGRKLRKYLAAMEQLYRLSTERLMYQDVRNVRTWTQKTNLEAAAGVLGKLKIWESWYTETDRYFRSEKLKKILGFPAVLLGGSPFNTPALHGILSWADFGKGVWYPKGGMGKVVEALVKLAQDHGARIITGAEVSEIEIRNGNVTAVRTPDRRFPAEVVVGATDIPMVETQLLPKAYRTWNKRYWQKKTLGISALLIYLGINRKINGLTHHNIYISDDWKENFREIFREKSLPRDPSFYISARSATDRTIVPENSEELFIMVPLGAGGSYPREELTEFSDMVIGKAEKLLGTEIRKHLAVREIFTPEQFAEDYNAYQGSALGLAHTLRQSLWLRPGNRSRKVRGLYYTGQYTNPGVGVPMALISAEIVAGMAVRTEPETDRIFRKGSVIFYYSSLFFRGQVRKDVFTLYAYLKVVDDFVDTDKPQITDMDHMRRETLKVWQGGKTGNTIVKGFVELARRKKFSRDWVGEFWQAMRSNLTKKHYGSSEELDRYMHGSAEVVGLMLARILDLPEAAMPSAALQGKAMQYINFIRDLKEDRTLGRNYLGYNEEWTGDREKWNKFIRKQITRYRQLQREAAKGYRYIPRTYLIPIRTAADMYGWMAERIYENPMLVLKKKIMPDKFMVLARVLINSLTLK